MKVKLGDLTKIRTGKLDANASTDDGAYPFFTCSREPLKISSYSYDCECVLVAGNGDLNVKYYNGKFDAYQRTYIIEAKQPDVLYMPYLYYFMEKYIVELRKLAIGGVIKYIKLGNLTDALIELPSYNQQRSLVERLEKVKSSIDKRNEQLEKLDELVKCHFVELFGDPILNEKKWITKPVKELTTKVGSGATPKGGDSSYKDSGISLIRSLNVHNNIFSTKELAHIDNEQANQLSNVTIQSGDVLLNITGASVARCCIVPDDILPARVNQHVCIIRCNDMLNPLFLERLLTSDNYQTYLWNVAEGGGGTRQALTKQQIENFSIITPPITLQTTFATFVSRIDKLRVIGKRSIIYETGWQS